MNEFWLMGAIIAFVVFVIFMILPATETKIIDLGFDLGDVFEHKATITIVIAIRILSFIISIGFLLLYLL